MDDKFVQSAKDYIQGTTELALKHLYNQVHGENVRLVEKYKKSLGCYSLEKDPKPEILSGRLYCPKLTESLYMKRLSDDDRGLLYKYRYSIWFDSKKWEILILEAQRNMSGIHIVEVYTNIHDIIVYSQSLHDIKDDTPNKYTRLLNEKVNSMGSRYYADVDRIAIPWAQCFMDILWHYSFKFIHRFHIHQKVSLIFPSSGMTKLENTVSARDIDKKMVEYWKTFIQIMGAVPLPGLICYLFNRFIYHTGTIETIDEEGKSEINARIISPEFVRMGIDSPWELIGILKPFCKKAVYDCEEVIRILEDLELPIEVIQNILEFY